MKKYFLFATFFIFLLFPFKSKATISFMPPNFGGECINGANSYQDCMERARQEECLYGLPSVCRKECINEASSYCEISSSSCYKSCIDRENLKSKYAGATYDFYKVSSSLWFNSCLGTSSLIGNKINNLGFVKFSTVFNKYNYIFSDIDNKIKENKANYDFSLEKETNSAKRLILNQEYKTRNNCLSNIKISFDKMLNQFDSYLPGFRAYTCYNAAGHESDLLKISSNVSGSCQEYSNFLDIYKEAHNSLCPSVDLYNPVKADLVVLNMNNMEYSNVGCPSGYIYDQCNLSCIKGDSSNLSYSNDLESGWLVKNKKFAEVFYVDNNLCLHWVINEKVASKNFGKKWNKNIKEYNEIIGYKFCDNLK